MPLEDLLRPPKIPSDKPAENGEAEEEEEKPDEEEEDRSKEKWFDWERHVQTLWNSEIQTNQKLETDAQAILQKGTDLFGNVDGDRSKWQAASMCMDAKNLALKRMEFVEAVTQSSADPSGSVPDLRAAFDSFHLEGRL